jgi:hypothetical protein
VAAGRSRGSRPRRVILPGVAELWISADRGRLVREAIAVLLADLDAGFDTSLVVQRPRDSTGDTAARAPVPGQDPAVTDPQ